MGIFAKVKKLVTPDPEIDFQLALAEETAFNFEKAAWLYQKAADRGHYKAKFFLAELILNGRIVPQDFEKAKALLAESSDAGYEKATELLADIQSGKYKLLRLGD